MRFEARVDRSRAGAIVFDPITPTVIAGEMRRRGLSAAASIRGPGAAVTGKTVEADTVEGGKLGVDGMSGVVLDGEAKVVTPDVAADNGVIHVIDTVVMPPA